MMPVDAFLLVADDNASWDMVTARDLWEDRLVDGENDSEQDGFILIRQEDIVDGIACFMADYLLSLQQMKVCQVPSYQKHNKCYLFALFSVWRSLY